MSKADKEKLLKERQKQIQQGLLDCLGTRHGRLFLWDLLEGFGVYRTSFDQQSPHLTSFNEGSRNEGLRLLARIARANPEGLAILMRENSERVGTNERRDSSDERGDGDAGSDTRD